MQRGGHRVGVLWLLTHSRRTPAPYPSHSQSPALASGLAQVARRAAPRPSTSATRAPRHITSSTASSKSNLGCELEVNLGCELEADLGRELEADLGRSRHTPLRPLPLHPSMAAVTGVPRRRYGSRSGHPLVQSR